MLQWGPGFYWHNFIIDYTMDYTIGFIIDLDYIYKLQLPTACVIMIILWLMTTAIGTGATKFVFNGIHGARDHTQLFSLIWTVKGSSLWDYGCWSLTHIIMFPALVDKVSYDFNIIYMAWEAHSKCSLVPLLKGPGDEANSKCCMPGGVSPIISNIIAPAWHKYLKVHPHNHACAQLAYFNPC